jgi:hypothetical protein
LIDHLKWVEFGAMTLSKMALSIMDLFETLGLNDTQQNITLSITVSSADMLSVTFFIVMPSVIMLNVVVLSVMVP